MRLHIQEGNRQVLLTSDASESPKHPGEVAELSLPVASASDWLHPRSVLVEFMAITGGQMPRALIGGTMFPNRAPALEVTLHLSNDVALADSDWDRPVPSALSSHSAEFARGIPREFGAATLRGLLQVPAGAGLLVIDRGGHDPVESSGKAFELTASVLMTALARDDSEEAEDDIRRLLRQ